MNLPVRLAARFTQSSDEPFAVKVVIKYRLAPVAAIHHMINRSGVFDAQLTRHIRWSIPTSRLCQYQD
jgi:hypothetical protein